MNLKGKVAIVTGASDGIGKQIAFKLAKKQTSLILVGRNKKRLELVSGQAKKLGSPIVKIYVCDISNSEAVSRVAKTIKTDFEKIHILINNAGIWQKLASLEEVPASTVNQVIRINLIGLIRNSSIAWKH